MFIHARTGLAGSVRFFAARNRTVSAVLVDELPQKPPREVEVSPNSVAVESMAWGYLLSSTEAAPSSLTWTMRAARSRSRGEPSPKRTT